MKKIVTLFLFYFFICNSSFAESYYFKECKLTDVLYGNYSIDFDKKIINVSLQALDGTYQEWEDKIGAIEKKRIVSEKIQSGASANSFFIYYLDTESKSVIKQKYKRAHEMDLVKPDGPKQQSFCADVKAGWDKKKILDADISKEQKQILEAQEKITKKQASAIKCQGNDHKQWTACLGTYVDKDGSKYTGQFQKGQIIEGSALYPGGVKYVGTFKNYKPHGEGSFTSPDGSKYFGQWKDGRNHGYGTKIWKDGKKYVGNFNNDVPHGQGTFTSPDGEEYVGEYKDGKRHGKGTLTYFDGSTFVGEFIAGHEHGEGTCFAKDGSSVTCKKDISSTGKNTHNIFFKEKKWIKISEYDSATGKAKKVIDKLENNFQQKANELCSSSGFNILEKRLEVLETDDTPAFGLETVLRLGINAVIECK